MENSLSIANFFIDKSLKEESELSPLKLLKLVYISHGWYLGLEDSPLIDDKIEAWKYGPVVPKIYHSFKHYGNEQITNLDFDIQTFSYLQPNDNRIVAFLKKIWEVYNPFTALQLSAMTHEINSPWDIVWNQQNGKAKFSAEIPNDIIKNYYKKRVADNTKK